MFLIKVKGNFSAAHQICDYPGDCSNLHGHNWKVQIVIASSELDELGMACDFREAKKILNDSLSELDHSYLNDIPDFEGENPTSERIAKTLYDNISAQLPEHLDLQSVEIFESDTSSVEYRP